jgi:adhesin transport system outer membrane protein
VTYPHSYSPRLPGRSALGRLAGLAGTAAALALLHSAPVAATSLEEAVRAGMANPEVREAAANRRAVAHDLREARALYYPTLDLRGDVGPEWFDTPTSTSDDHWLWRRSASVLVRQRLFDGFGTENEVERQRSRVSSAASRVIERAEFLALDVVQAYLDVMRQIDLVGYAEDNVQAHTATLRDVQSRVRAGRSGVGDQRQAESRLAQAQADLVEAQRRLDDSRAAYVRLVGAEPADLSRPAVPGGTVAPTLEEALERARHRNPSVTVALRDIDTADAEVLVTEAPWWPRLDLEITGTQAHNIDGLQGDNDSFSALIVARWNLYAGGGDTARRAGAIERAAEAREAMKRIAIQAYEETRRSWSAMVRQRQQVEVLRDRLRGAEGVLAAYRQQFDVGQRDLLDVLDAQQDVFIARTNLTTAEFSELFANYRLLAVTGDLLPALKIEDPAEAEGGRAAQPAAMGMQSGDAGIGAGGEGGEGGGQPAEPASPESGASAPMSSAPM